MIKLTPEQRQQLEFGRAVDVIDEETAQRYVVVPKDVYQRVEQLVGAGSEWTDDDLRLLLARSSAGNGWNEPGMDAYDREEERSKQCP